MAKEKGSFEESLRRFREKGKALRSALETAQTSASGNVASLKHKHQASMYECVRSGWLVGTWSMKRTGIPGTAGVMIQREGRMCVKPVYASLT